MLEFAVLDENKETPSAISSYERFTCQQKKKCEGCRIVVGGILNWKDFCRGLVGGTFINDVCRKMEFF